MEESDAAAGAAEASVELAEAELDELEELDAADAEEELDAPVISSVRLRAGSVLNT